MNKQKILSISIILLLIISLIAAIISSVYYANQSKTPQDDRTPSEIYTDAANKVLQAKDLSLSISTAKNTTRGEDVYIETSNQTLLYNNIGKENMLSHSRQTKSYGDYQITMQTAFKNNTAFYYITGGTFRCPSTPKEYVSDNLPAVLLNASLYKKIEMETGDVTTTITFSQPEAAESWALPKGGKLTKASGTAKLHNNGLLQTVYEINYQIGGTDVMEIFRVDANTAKPTITLPDTKEYLPIENIDTLLLLEQSVGYLHQANKVTATTKQSIESEVTGHSWTQNSTLNFYDDKATCSVRQDITTQVIDSGAADASTKKSQSIIFTDGKYKTIVDGGDAVYQDGVTDDSMRTYCRDTLVSTILMSKYITSVAEKETDATIQLTFTANEDMASTMCQNAWQILFGNPDYIGDLDTAAMTGYIYIDKETLLPVASGVSYDGTYDKNGHKYHLKFNAEQEYTIPSETAYQAIHE